MCKVKCITSNLDTANSTLDRRVSTKESKTDILYIDFAKAYRCFARFKYWSSIVSYVCERATSKYHGIVCVLFADDNKCYRTVRTKEDVQYLQCYLEYDPTQSEWLPCGDKKCEFRVLPHD